MRAIEEGCFFFVCLKKKKKHNVFLIDDLLPLLPV